MEQGRNVNNKTATERGGHLRRLWGALPALFLVLLAIGIVVLTARIVSEGKRLAEEKRAALKAGRPAVNVVLLEVVPAAIRDMLSLPAEVEPWVELEVLAEVPGKVLQVPVKEGDYVRKGSVIARIDDRDYKNELASVRASYELALKTLTRRENLYKEEIIPKSELDSARAQVDALEAEAKNAELRLERSVISAPMSGTINRLDAKEGLFLKLHDAVAVILDTNRVKVKVGIPESDVDAVRDIEDFQVTIDALGGRRFKGKKRFLSRSPETLARLYSLEIEVRNPAGEILPGMFARVSIVKKEARQAITVPLYSVITRDERQFVLVEKDGKARVRMVETGILEGWRIQITKGLEPGDRVIVVGQRNVGEGQELDVIRTVTDPEDFFR